MLRLVDQFEGKLVLANRPCRAGRLHLPNLLCVRMKFRVCFRIYLRNFSKNCKSWSFTLDRGNLYLFRIHQSRGLRHGDADRRASAEGRDPKKKNVAKVTYENAVKEGKTASLLQQHRVNVFEMRVGNILPQDRIEVILRYTEILVPTDVLYSFVYPTVVGPRYSNQSVENPNADHWVANPYLQEGEPSKESFSRSVQLAAGMPIQDLSCATDRFNVLLFAGDFEVYAESSVTATHANVKHALAFLRRRRGGGGTELMRALAHAYALPSDEKVSRSIVIITDGYVAVENASFRFFARAVA